MSDEQYGDPAAFLAALEANPKLWLELDWRYHLEGSTPSRGLFQLLDDND